MRIQIRRERINDCHQTESVIKRAFANAEMTDHKEHELVARLRCSEAFVPELSLVAENNGDELIGHVLLTKVTIGIGHKTESLALAPVSVLPQYQKQGIGKILIDKAIEKAGELGYTSVIVLGHPEYYHKFGFKQASSFEIQPPFEAPPEAFMALEIYEGSLHNVSGIVKYPPEFM
ncbi:GNAT family N-acetyltransferase [Halobacillus litoralis]|uniref:GNAT family N-acetyltransferase n=1 Tax=Halobacillus litoralis TaxID=45668 RepID=A0A410MHW0_9BACI|nr:N-acetyltransferase [Halobacillus litoralis]QAS54327.1 GNAT family N-acetyltransferase [Halobacillus litoralis]